MMKIELLCRLTKLHVKMRVVQKLFNKTTIGEIFEGLRKATNR